MGENRRTLLTSIIKELGGNLCTTHMVAILFIVDNPRNKKVTVLDTQMNITSQFLIDCYFNLCRVDPKSYLT